MTRSKPDSLRNRALVILSLVAMTLQGMTGGHAFATAGAVPDAGGPGFGFQVICTPSGLITIGPDGNPVEEDGNERSAGAGSGACHVCCNTACSGHLGRRGHLTLAFHLEESLGSGLDRAMPHPALFRPALPVRGPPRLA